ncbi:LysR family transcriptional regulator [Massilia sp. IC2-476]|uniref:LysR family transcriptional regulator n=1 Tax=Massilia sp. IC2-476 TaxID=2887199 RepID=UPI001D120EFE|nr:LysR family transcriptional regulator [Massilia sp. IC2-476]MCC2973779.1 LysR family transcriptional regulator [Massilia sp. IC2-476]
MKMNDPVQARFDSSESPDSACPSVIGESLHAQNRNLRISLRQWKMFHAVIDADGFVGAANQLHVSQSSISHALTKLQEQLGVPLLTLKGRKAQITEEGKVLLARSRELVRNAAELEELAEHLRHGWGREVRVAVDLNFPPDLLMLAMRELSSQPRKTRISVKEANLEQAAQALRDKTADLAISAQTIPGFACRELLEIEHVAVAHPDNPLFALKRPLGADDLKSQLQIAVAGAGDEAAAEAPHGLTRLPRPWTVSTLDWAIGALRHGLGYAWLPRHRVQRWLDGNQVRILPLKHGASFKTRLYLVHAPCADTGTVAFAEALQACSNRPV